MRKIAVLLFPVLLVAVAGCGLAEKATDSAAEKAVEKFVENTTGVKVDQDNNSVTIKGEDGKELTITSDDGGELPKDFPLPVMAGGKVTVSSTMHTESKKGWSAEIQFDADPKQVGDFYEAAAKERGLKVTRMDTTDGGAAVTLMGESDKETAFISITRYDPQKPTTMNLMWGDK